jgi:hypothetical protein
MTLGLTQPLREMGTRNISCRVKAAGAKVDNLTPSYADFLEILGASNSRSSQKLSKPLMGLFYLLLKRCKYKPKGSVIGRTFFRGEKNGTLWDNRA